MPRGNKNWMLNVLIHYFNRNNNNIVKYILFESLIPWCLWSICCKKEKSSADVKQLPHKLKVLFSILIKMNPRAFQWQNLCEYILEAYETFQNVFFERSPRSFYVKKWKIKFMKTSAAIKSIELVQNSRMNYLNTILKLFENMFAFE